MAFFEIQFKLGKGNVCFLKIIFYSFVVATFVKKTNSEYMSDADRAIWLIQYVI